MSTPHIFGIRHHGPGSARSLRRALQELKPDVLLIEGPPDAADVLPLLAHKAMKPPVAMLLYAPDEPQRAVYYPLALFSPEWQAIHFALKKGIPVRFMDLPQAHHFALDKAAEEEMKAEMEKLRAEMEAKAAQEERGNAPTLDGQPAPDAAVEENQTQASEIAAQMLAARRDPLLMLAHAAGYDDSERWWEHMIEHRQDGTNLFAGILEAMTALRSALEADEMKAREEAGVQASSTPDGGVAESALPEGTPSATPDLPPGLPFDKSDQKREEMREAFMRQTIRAAQKEGFERIAVVCGAWHGPALAEMPPAKDDAALLKGLPKAKVQATWVPWTHGRLAFASGYGAGIESPGWYHHLWTSRDRVATRWMARVAGLLRDEGLDVSSAHVIEGVRLAESLAILRGRALPDLSEMNEAIQSIFCFGDDLPLRLIHDKLTVGETLGAVPDETPMVPLQQDILREQKRLRLAPEAGHKELDLDLRKPNDLDRSYLLHRLSLLGVPWGEVQHTRGKSSTFHEEWFLQWRPELAIALIEAGVWGNTVESAASAKTRDAADKAKELPALTSLVGHALLANLPDAIEHVMTRLQDEAALASDVAHLMDALPPLASTLRYGNVRKTDAGMIGHVVDGLVARIAIGLPAACASLNDEAAAVMYEKVQAVNGAIGILNNAEYAKTWQGTLRHLTDSPNLHGLIAGRCCRILRDAGALSPEESENRMSLALSTANEPPNAAAWLEGFLKGSGLLLLHDESLWGVLDEWVASLSPDTFTALLPLLRRTFATFSSPERRQMGERVKREPGHVGTRGTMLEPADFDAERAAAVLPLVAKLLGLKAASLPSG